MTFTDDTYPDTEILVERAAARAVQESRSNPSEQAQKLSRLAARLGYVNGLRAAAILYEGVISSPQPPSPSLYKEMLLRLMDGAGRWPV